MLAPVRESLATGVRLKWTPVNVLPDYVYFNHSVHVTNGVACTECHGSVGEMRLMRQAAPLTMQWCLNCHRDPVPHLQPPERITYPYRTASQMAEIDPGAAPGVLRHPYRRADRLLDMPPMSRAKGRA